MASQGRGAGRCGRAKQPGRVIFPRGRGPRATITRRSNGIAGLPCGGLPGRKPILAYYRGGGLRRDYVIAYMWLFLAIAHGDEGPREDLGIVETNLTAAEKAEAEKLARDWRPQAAALP